MGKVLIVDDTDPNIYYSGSWAINGTLTSVSHEYNSTLHRGDTNGQTLSYTFNGIGIRVYGDLDSPATNGLVGVQFQVDGAQPQQINATGAITFNINQFVTHQVLYQSPDLNPGKHTIDIQITNATTQGPYFYFDFFTVYTGQDSVTGHVILDDRDETIEPFPEWILAGDPLEYMNTTLWPPNTGSYVTMQFNGTELNVYGTTDNSRTNGAAQIRFELDGVKGYTYTDPFPIPSSYTHNLFFSQAGLNDGQHTLKITALNNHIWTLDYIIYTTSNSSVNAAASSGENGGGDGDGGGGEYGGNLEKRKSNIGAIVGGVVGGIVAIGVLFLIIFFLLRRQRKNQDRSAQPFHSIDPAVAFPHNTGAAATTHTIQTLQQNSFQMLTQPQSQTHAQPHSESIQHSQVRYTTIPASKNSSSNPLLGYSIARPNPMTSGSSVDNNLSRNGGFSGHSISSGIIHPNEYSVPIEVDSGQRFRPLVSQTHKQSTITAPPLYTAD